MKKKLISLLLFPLIALSQAGDWEMDFDEDFAAASSAWSPLSIADCKMWLDAADASTVQATGAAVTNWLDKSTAGNHAVEYGTTFNRPQYIYDADSGLNSISFDGSDALITPLAPTTEMSMFIVVLPTTFNAARVFFGSTGGANLYSFLFANSTNTLGVAWGARYYPEIEFNWASKKQVCAMSVGGGTIRLWRGQSLILSDSSSGSLSEYPFLVGGLNSIGTLSPRHYGLICEIVIYTRVLTDVERNRVVDYLMQKWGIP